MEAIVTNESGDWRQALHSIKPTVTWSCLELSINCGVTWLGLSKETGEPLLRLRGLAQLEQFACFLEEALQTDKNGATRIKYVSKMLPATPQAVHVTLSQSAWDNTFVSLDIDNSIQLVSFAQLAELLDWLALITGRQVAKRYSDESGTVVFSGSGLALSGGGLRLMEIPLAQVRPLQQALLAAAAMTRGEPLRIDLGGGDFLDIWPGNEQSYASLTCFHHGRLQRSVDFAKHHLAVLAAQIEVACTKQAS